MRAGIARRRGALGMSGLVFAAMLFAPVAQGQTLSVFRGYSLVRDDAGSFRLRVDTNSLVDLRAFRLETRLLPKQTRSIDPIILTSLRSLGRPRYMPSYYASASRPARAQARSYLATPCRGQLPFSDPPIDADGALSRCSNAGLANVAISALHMLSVQANQH